MSDQDALRLARGEPVPALEAAAGGRLSRRALLRGAGGVVVAGGSGGGELLVYRSRQVSVPLLSETVAFSGGPSRSLVPPGRQDDLLPASRVLRSAPDAADLLAQEQRWLAAGPAWTTTGPWADLARAALLDVRALLLPGGALVAGWSGGWRYVWPRDAAHAAAALAVCGHPDDALSVLRFLQRVQGADGSFEARYLPDGSGPPDGRPRQLDGTGWALWATARLVDARAAGDCTTPSASSAGGSDLRVLEPMVRRAVGLILRQIENPRALPAPSPDYWEVTESTLTLGTVAPLLAGLDGAVDLCRLLGDDALAEHARAGAERLRRAVQESFGTRGYPRRIDGHHKDAALAFLFPPYVDRPSPAALAALRHAEATMRRPAGGLAPGAGWKNDGISWTPETALFGLAAAGTGDHARARRWLAWLGEHRTAAGSFPEKVLHDGRPAAVAPLAWTAAVVLLTLSALQP